MNNEKPSTTSKQCYIQVCGPVLPAIIDWTSLTEQLVECFDPTRESPRICVMWEEVSRMRITTQSDNMAAVGTSINT